MSEVAATTQAGPGTQTLRLAELVAALSLGIDLGFAQPMEHVLRQCLIALRLATHLGLDDRHRSAVYYTALLIDVGCHTDAHEQAKWFGDDIALKSAKFDRDMRSIAAVAAGMRQVGAGHQPLHRLRIGLEFAAYGHRQVDGMVAAHSRLARGLAHDLGLSDLVQDAVAAAYERWDGRGWPGDLSGEQIPLAARIANLAEYTEVAHRMGGVGAAQALVRERSGKQFDPHLARLLDANAEAIFGGLDALPTWTAVIEGEPALRVMLHGPDVDAALCGIADFVDLKSPFLLGHARGVAMLAEGAAVRLGLSAAQVDLTRRAGLVQGFGRLGVSNAIWDKPGPLGAGERERVRLQPYLTERMLHQSASLAPIGAVAAQLRERLDGSGYPRGLTGDALGMPARIVAASDVYQAMIEPRPYREALPADRAVAELRAEAAAGRLDADVVAAVLATAGHSAVRRAARPAGLTDREVDVLRLVAQGLSHRQIADRLVIAPKTARNHIEHIYAKVGATSRVTASLFAVQHGLLPASG